MPGPRLTSIRLKTINIEARQSSPQYLFEVLNLNNIAEKLNYDWLCVSPAKESHATDTPNVGAAACSAKSRRTVESMFPEEYSVAVSRGLSEAFGTISIEEIRMMTKGLSSDLMFRIVVKGSPYLLRIMTRIDERNDPERVFTCMNSAAEARLDPRVWYSNTTDGLAITDWIEAVLLIRSNASLLSR